MPSVTVHCLTDELYGDIQLAIVTGKKCNLQKCIKRLSPALMLACLS